MIPVTAQPEPGDFDATVRKPGLAWVKKQGLDSSKPVPAGKKVSSFWGKCAGQLWESYGGICAYSCFYIHRTTGSTTVEHFAPKSRKLGLAFEWKNFRLVCGLMNSRKSDYEDVLDPFSIEKGTFEMDFVTGDIRPGPNVSAILRKQCEMTILRLKLNEEKCRRDRLEPLNQFARADISLAHFKRYAPFVWFEAQRQGLL